MKYTFLIIITFLSIPAISFDSPREAVVNHLENLQKDNYYPEKSAKSLYPKSGNYNYERLAKRLKQFFDSKGLIINIKNIPDENNYKDSVKDIHRFILFEDYPGIFLEKYNDKWYYSSETVSKINSYYKQIFPPGLEDILSTLPDFLFLKFINIELWKWAGLLIFSIISIILYLILNKLLITYTYKILNKSRGGEKLHYYISRVARPLSFVIIVTLLDTFFPYLQLPLKLSNALNFVIKVLQPILITIIIYRITDLIGDMFEKYAEKTESTVDDQLVPLVRKTIKIVVVVIGIFYIVNNLGIDYTPLLAGASVGGLALALAAQDTMKNFFGSITIFTDKPFDVGDWIKFGNDEGTVEEVGVRSTRIRTFHNSLVSIPNGRISDMVVDNMGRRKFRRYYTVLTLKYNTDPEKLKKFVEELKDELLAIKDSRKDYFEINLNNFGQYGLEVLVYVFFKTGTWTDELAARQEFIYRALELAKKLEIEFAYPTQTINIGEKDNNNLSKIKELDE